MCLADRFEFAILPSFLLLTSAKMNVWPFMAYDKGVRAFLGDDHRDEYAKCKRPFRKKSVRQDIKFLLFCVRPLMFKCFKNWWLSFDYHFTPLFAFHPFYSLSDECFLSNQSFSPIAMLVHSERVFYTDTLCISNFLWNWLVLKNYEF